MHVNDESSDCSVVSGRISSIRHEVTWCTERFQITLKRPRYSYRYRYCLSVKSRNHYKLARWCITCHSIWPARGVK